MIELSPLNTDQSYQRGFSGDTFNTAWYLRRLAAQNWDISYLTAIGDDTISQEFLKFMKAADIGSIFVETKSNRTLGLYMIHLDAGERSFTYWRGESAARNLADSIERLEKSLLKADLIYFSGITTAIVGEIGRLNLFRVIEAAKSRGQTIVFDPNLRPRLWPSITEMVDQTTKFAELADIVLPSFEDESTYFNDPTPDATVKRYVNCGANIVVVKNSINEIVAVHGELRAQMQPKKIALPTDTTAAGDSFNAGFLAMWINGASLSDSITFGASVSAKVVSGRGALVQLPSG